ncbi:hypothetical protein [Roseitalea sp. MMSF_3504]|uniref:DUF6949 family protein n=1 Tax=Roseitalea sp. MMSF_3504 TaxID=3046716 RepID=UPI00273FB32D|nr:hypothetical protein [Roseitalea sp. MMSF_3504]
MAIVAGFSVALAAYHWMAAVLDRSPGFDRQTVTGLGAAVSVLGFALCGPVLVLRAGGGRAGRGGSALRLAALCLSPFWAGLIGIVAFSAGRLVAMA